MDNTNKNETYTKESIDTIAQSIKEDTIALERSISTNAESFEQSVGIDGDTKSIDTIAQSRKEDTIAIESSISANSESLEQSVGIGDTKSIDTIAQSSESQLTSSIEAPCDILMTSESENQLISNIISNRTSVSSTNSNSVSFSNSVVSRSPTTISGITNHWEEKIIYPTLYHVIIIGSPDYKYNHFASKEYSALDREMNGKHRIYFGSYECQHKQKLSEILNLALREVPSPPQYSNYFVYIKGDYPHMLIDESMTIAKANLLNPSIEVGKIFFCLILDRSNCSSIEPSENAFLHMMKNQRKLSSTTYHPFTKSAGSFNEAKEMLVSQFAHEGILGACSQSQADKMNKALYWSSVMIYYIDGHFDKMNRYNGFKLPSNLISMVGRNESSVVFRKLNKETLKDLSTQKLISHANNLEKALANIYSPTILQTDTFKSIVQMKKSIDLYIAQRLHHNVRQDEVRNNTAVATSRGQMIRIPNKKGVLKNSKLTELIGVLQASQVGNYISIREIEDRYVDASLNEKYITNGRELDLVRTKRQIARREFRDHLEKGLPVHNIFMYRHIFGNNKPQIRIAFRVTVEDMHNQIAEAMTYCESQVPKVLLKSQCKKIEEAVKNIRKMKFAKNSTMAKYLLSVISEEYDIDNTMNEEDRAAINNEIQIMLEIEDNNLLQDCLLSHKKFYGGESEYDIFIDKLLEVMHGEAVPDARRNDSYLYSYKFISIEDLIDEVADRLPPEYPIPKRHWVSLQFIPSNCRALSSSKYTARIPMKRKIQRHTIVKNHVDGQYCNALLRNVRTAFKRLGVEVCSYFACDDKNKIKIGPPGEPLALANRCRKKYVPESKDLNSLDHDMSIKASFTPSVSLKVGEVFDNKLSSMYSGESTVILKDSNTQGSEPFRHTIELIKYNLTMKQTVLIKQSDGGIDHNNTSPRVILAAILFLIRLKVVCVVLVRNAPGQSVYNPAEHVMAPLSLALMVLAVCRDEPKDKVIEDEIKKCGSVKNFIEAFKETRPEYVSAYEQTMETPRSLIEDAFARTRYAGNRIKVGEPCTEEDIKDNIELLRNYVPFIPQDPRKCKPSEIFKKAEGQAWFNKHVKVGKYMTHIYRGVEDCECEVCAIPYKDDTRFPGFIPYPHKIDKDHYAVAKEFIPMNQYQDEINCPSLNGTRLGKYMKNANSLNNSTALFTWPCSSCGKLRIIYGTRRLVPKELIDWTLDYLEDYEYTCGDPLWPNNDINTTDIPVEWKDPKLRIEFRHNLTCSSLLEIQIDSMKVDGDLLTLCCYCSTDNIDTNNIVKGYRPICNVCSQTKQIVKVASTKGDSKRSMADAIDRNRVKRTRRGNEESNIRSDVSTSASFPTQRSTSSHNREDIVETILPADNEPMIQDFLSKYELQYVTSPGIGDCLIQSAMKSYFNKAEDFGTEDEKKVSKLKWSISNAVLNGDTMEEGDKYKLWRGYRIGDTIEDSNLYMGDKDITILAHILKRKILVIHIKIENGKKYIFGDLYTPRRGTVLTSSERPIRFTSTNEMYYLLDRRKPDQKTYVHPCELLQQNKGIIIYHYGIHYDAIIDPNKPPRYNAWPNTISTTIFQPTVSKKLCPVCSIYSWGSDVVQCVLCERWAHYDDDDDKKCDNYYEDYDLNDMTGANYYCKTCLDILVSFYVNVFADTKIESIQTCLCSFNINGVLENERDNDVFKCVIRNAIEFYRTTNSSSSLADVPMEEV